MVQVKGGTLSQGSPFYTFNGNDRGVDIAFMVIATSSYTHETETFFTVSAAMFWLETIQSIEEMRYRRIGA